MLKKPYFEPVGTKVNFPEMEKELLDEWYKSGLVKKYLQKNKNSEKYFSFLDGPITANNPMGVHHAWGRTYKDLWPRFKNMQGFKQRFQNGFDCQGLWVEVEVEKELGLKNKHDIENLVPGDKKASIAKFVDLCKERVFKFSKIQTEQSKRLGYFADWDNSYYTLSDDNNYMIWHFLKMCHEKGLIYKGHDSVPWCPRCGTAISQHEMLTEDYKEVTHGSIYFELPIVGRKDEYLLVWTTTPWTLPGNIAVAVDATLEYSLVEGNGGDKFWLAKALVEKVFKGGYKKVVKTVLGKELVGLTYKWAFDELPRVKEVAEKNKGKFHVVIATDDRLMPVTVDEGTGLVHTAVSAGEEDFKIGQKLGLPMIDIIDEEANYLPGLGEFSGKNAKKDPRVILDYLLEREKKGEDWVFEIAPYKHRYPACWRCRTELVWRVVDEWYISMDSLRDPLRKVVKKINWIPGFGLKRELDWVKNMHDWLISKKRYWGLALPIWVCKNNHFEVVGSKEELKEKAISGWDKFDGHTPHRPWIDEVKLKCSECGEEMERIPDVGNPWLDAGIVPFSTISRDNKSKPLYLTEQKEWEKWFPVDFITESFPGQFKNWFYSLLAQSTVLENSEPFKTVLGFGTLLGEDGRAMHKSWGNAIEFNEGADKIGVDVMRWMYVRQNAAENLLFGYKVADEVRRRFHLKLWNVYNFFVTYANLDGWRPTAGSKQLAVNSKQLTVLDRWIITRLNQTLKEVTESLESYDAFTASVSIETFVDDLSLWYIRRSRSRVGPAAESEVDKNAFYETCHMLLVTLSKLLAPFTPFLSEVIYKNLAKEESVHLSDWPEGSKQSTVSSKQLIVEMQKVREIVEKAHAIRKEKEIPVRQPLLKLQITNYELQIEELEQLVKDEVNVKEIEFIKGKGALSVKLDTKITPELEEEARARELVRNIQEERKRMRLNLTQKVSVQNGWLPKDKKITQWILRKTFATKIVPGDFRVFRAK